MLNPKRKITALVCSGLSRPKDSHDVSKFNTGHANCDAMNTPTAMPNDHQNTAMIVKSYDRDFIFMINGWGLLLIYIDMDIFLQPDLFSVAVLSNRVKNYSALILCVYCNAKLGKYHQISQQNEKSLIFLWNMDKF